MTSQDASKDVILSEIGQILEPKGIEPMKIYDEIKKKNEKVTSIKTFINYYVDNGAVTNTNIQDITGQIKKKRNTVKNSSNDTNNKKLTGSVRSLLRKEETKNNTNSTKNVNPQTNFFKQQMKAVKAFLESYLISDTTGPNNELYKTECIMIMAGLVLMYIIRQGAIEDNTDLEEYLKNRMTNGQTEENLKRLFKNLSEFLESKNSTANTEANTKTKNIVTGITTQGYLSKNLKNLFQRSNENLKGVLKSKYQDNEIGKFINFIDILRVLNLVNNDTQHISLNRIKAKNTKTNYSGICNLLKLAKQACEINKNPDNLKNENQLENLFTGLVQLRESEKEICSFLKIKCDK